MKKVILLIFTIALAFSMASCVSKDADTETAESIVYQKAQEIGFDGYMQSPESVGSAFTPEF